LTQLTAEDITNHNKITSESEKDGTESTKYLTDDCFELDAGMAQEGFRGRAMAGIWGETEIK